jgi:hypothetical protein
LPEGHIHWEYEGIDERIILKWFLRKYGWSVDWIHVVQIEDLWWAIVNPVMKLRVHNKDENCTEICYLMLSFRELLYWSSSSSPSLRVFPSVCMSATRTVFPAVRHHKSQSACYLGSNCLHSTTVLYYVIKAEVSRYLATHARHLCSRSEEHDWHILLSI